MKAKVAEAIEHLKKLPEGRQEVFAEMILHEGEAVYELSDAEKAAIEEGLADIEAGRVVTEADFLAKLDARNVELKSTTD